MSATMLDVSMLDVSMFGDSMENCPRHISSSDTIEAPHSPPNAFEDSDEGGF